MNSRLSRFFLPGLLVLSVLVFIAVCVLGLSMLSKQSQKMVNLKLQSKVLDDQIASLAQAKKQVQQYSYIKTVAKEIIPNDKDQAEAVLEIFQLASDSGFSINSIGFPVSTLGAAPADAASADPSALISQAKPVLGIKGLYSVQLTIVPQTGNGVPPDQIVTYAKMLDFLDRLELNQRTAQITQIIIQPLNNANGDASSGINFTLTVNIFIKP